MPRSRLWLRKHLGNLGVQHNYVAPLREPAAYFPRTLRLKSYPARMSRSRTRSSSLLIVFLLRSGGQTGADGTWQVHPKRGSAHAVGSFR